MGKVSRLKLGLLIAVSALVLLWAMFWPVGNKLVICTAYADIPDGTEIKAYKELNFEGFSDINSNTQRTDGGTAYFKLGWNHDELTNIMIKPTDGSNSVLLAFITVYLQHNLEDTLVYKLDPSLIMADFEIADGDWEIDESGMLRITPGSEDCEIIGSTQELTDSIKVVDESLKHQVKVSRFSSALIVLCLLWLIAIFADEIAVFFEKQDKWSLVSMLAIVVAGIGVWVIAFNSGLDHPDEFDVVKCLKWAMTHFLPPDMRLEDVADTYSGYGYTKLANSTWYFLIAGKVAWIARKMWDGILYYRVPNFLMFAVLAFFYVKQIQRKRWLTLAFGVCAQAWYIFSYTTADAMDFFLCFIVLILLTDEDSVFFKASLEKFEIKGIWRHLILGVLFGFIFLGKPNYWVMLLLAFIILLFKLIEASKEDRRNLWINYCVIIAFFVVTVATRYAFDLYHYGFGMSEVSAEMEEIYSAYDKNPATPAQDIAVTYRMIRYGHSFPELFMAAPTWFKSTFRSFCGVSGDSATKDAYFKLMGILYGFVVCSLTYYGFKGVSAKSRNDKIKMSLMFVLFVASFLASIVNSYVSDSQPQGRYLLPMLFTASYIAYLTPEIFEKKFFNASLIALQVLSAWYFVTAGVGCFV